ncbi:MAG: bacteriophage abortive infection AbiH family protein [Bacteroidales bacterium]|nr:bacteriophage abortive infection AbiH family protein [Bacteroidales bacterium]MBQ6184930.1 bacteriophage abortive infection AbiH family protein [Bacteroidales bacterium]
MNIVFFIGNGFDIAQGLKTKYSDFYKSYKKSTPVNETEKKIIASIDESQDTWSDLEATLGVFTQELNNPGEFIDAYESLNLKLREYLKGQESLFLQESIQRYRNELANPFVDLSYSNQVKFYDLYKSETKVATVNVISYNYTNVFERAIGYQYQPITLKSSFFPFDLQVNNVYKVHGSLQGTILMGVNDASQIANKVFAEDMDVCDFFIKPRLNSALGYYFDQFALRSIESADLIVVYGMSIGKTDEIWWKSVAQRMLSSSCQLLIFKHLESPIPAELGWRAGKVIRQTKTHFARVAEISDNLDAPVMNRITVSLSGGLFNPNYLRADPIVQ